MTLLFCDDMVMDESPRMTTDGYLAAMPRVARTGLQEYAGFEVGRPELETARIYRPEDEVFNTDSMNSWAHKPVTIDHPPVLVDAKNWKKYSRGHVGDEVVRDGEFIRVPMMLADNDAIDAVRKGKSQISMGYSADLDWTPGTTPSGEAYDAVQRKIRGNHLAIVDTARGGPALRVYDAQLNRQEEAEMPKSIIIDGISVEVSDTAAQVIDKMTKQYDDEVKTLTDAKASAETKLADSETKLATVEAENATLKQQLKDAEITPEKMDAAVAERGNVIDSAKKVLSTVTTDGKSVSEIRRQVVDARLGETAKEWTDEQVSASFAALCASSTQKDSTKSAPVKDGDAYNNYKQNLSDAWKQKEA